MKYNLTTNNLRAHLITLHPGKLGDLESEEPQLKQTRITSFLPEIRENHQLVTLNFHLQSDIVSTLTDFRGGGGFIFP